MRTHYIDRDGAALAHQVVGEGPVDLVLVNEIVIHLDLAWTDPDFHRNFERFAGFARAAIFQRRGFGLSDQVSYAPTVEQQAEDVIAVMDSVGMRSATLAGLLGTCGALALVAAKAPERVNALVLINPLAQGPESSDDLHGWTDAEKAAFVEGYRHAVANWGSGEIIDMWDPVQATSFNRRLTALLERSSATPIAAQAYFEWFLGLDIQDVLRTVQVPARVLCVPSTPLPEAAVRYVAELLPRGTFHLLPPTPPGVSIGQAFIPVTEHVEEVGHRIPPLGGRRPVPRNGLVHGSGFIHGDARPAGRHKVSSRALRPRASGATGRRERRRQPDHGHGRRYFECVRRTHQGREVCGDDLS